MSIDDYDFDDALEIYNEYATQKNVTDYIYTDLDRMFDGYDSYDIISKTQHFKFDLNCNFFKFENDIAISLTYEKAKQIVYHNREFLKWYKETYIFVW